MNLVIVESPAKARTIEKFLGQDFKVESSFGHVRDLPKSDLGIDVEHDFEPRYIIPTKAKKQVALLKKIAAKADKIILATDEDREGEAIAWHLLAALGLEKTKKEIERIVFHEITAKAILEALKHPRAIEQNLVDAQQARRVLDRLVGYKLSPMLWKKVSRGLSAGRVQSVAVRLVVERERERENFKKQEYWDLIAKLQTIKDQGQEIFEAKLIKINDKVLDKFAVPDQKSAQKIVDDLTGAAWKVEAVEKKETKRNAYPPFTTSTLQQSAARKLGFSAKRTMMLAQQLYEGADINGDRTGLITYMRTDSLNLSQDAVAEAASFIKSNFGEKYLETKVFKTKAKGAQEAHEAIRPTDPQRTPEAIAGHLDPAQLKLYRLIWQRFMASQMSPAVFDATIVDVSANNHIFRANGITKKFDGFTKVYSLKTEETILPELKTGEPLNLIELKPDRHFTEPPARYSEATLVKALEQHGIGRPSTYAPTLSTIQYRGYVERDEQKKFKPSQMGIIVNDLLVEHFPKIVDINFTAQMEKNLDKIAEDKIEWVPVIREFYGPFEANLKEKMDELKKTDFKRDEPTDKVCPECGKPIVIKLGRFGKFYACTGWPECKHTERIVEKIDMKCPKCVEGEVIVKRTRTKKTFYGCSNYPKCDYASWTNPKIKTKEIEESQK
ncbi:MAG: type I DNA topoisomerase [Candidatus Sungbacteria bacterium]|uniref:DNA topoisomerase 1 n=1 Tax=Candidatus Sungiibacteriota bacterium TaxID=2750080 RepID=A0A931YDK6_9BACT|nr:type I DNA topoisomerase [Candidatus Sungbacteria bacterium]